MTVQAVDIARFNVARRMLSAYDAVTPFFKGGWESKESVLKMSGFFVGFRRLVLCALVFATTFCLFVGKFRAFAEQPLPSLDDDLLKQLQQEKLQKDAKAVEKSHAPSFTMLDFYSRYCGVCQQAEPYLNEIQRQLKGDVRFIRVDADKKETLSKQFHIEGTPTYILYDPQGKPVYRMHRYISVEILYTQLERFTGKIKPRMIPSALLPQTLASTYTLIAIHPKDCQPCKAKMPFLNAMTFAADAGNDLASSNDTSDKSPQRHQPGLMIREWDPEDPQARHYIEAFKWPQGQGYVLLDPSARELLQAKGDIDPQLLWKNIRLLSDTGL